MENYESREYKRSRRANVIQISLEYFVELLAGDAFIAKLLRDLGFSEGWTGVITSFIALAYLFGLFALLLTARGGSVKKTVVIFDTVSVLCFGAVFLVPFAPVGRILKYILTVLLLLVAYFARFSTITMYYGWANCFIAPEKRGRFSAVREMVALLSGVVFSLVIGFVMDAFEAAGNLHGAFLFIAVSVFVISVGNFIALYSIAPEPQKEAEQKQEKTPLREVLRNTLGNRFFVSVTAMASLWFIAQYLVIGFLGTFKTETLGWSAGAVQVINMVGLLGRFAASRPLGAYSDRTSYAKGYKLGLVIAGIGFLCCIFTTRAARWLIIPATLCLNTALAGTVQNGNNIIYNCVDKKYFAQALAIKNAIAGLLSFLASLAGAKLLGLVQANGNTVFGIPMAGQQLLAVIALVIAAGDILFVRTRVEKERILLQ